MKTKIKFLIPLAIIAATVFLMGVFFMRQAEAPKVTPVDMNEEVAPNSQLSVKEKEAYDRKMEKLREGLFEAFYGKVMEIDRETGTMKVEADQLEQPKIIEVYFNEKTEVLKLITETNKKDRLKDVDSTEEEVPFEERIERSESASIRGGSEVQVQPADFFDLSQAEKIEAVKIIIFEKKVN